MMIFGDSNFHVDDLADKYESIFLSSMVDVDLCQHVTLPTHASGHTLDLVIRRPADTCKLNTYASTKM